MNGGKDFLWVSEKDGWRHLYRISRDGKKETLLTKGSYDLITIRAIDEKICLLHGFAGQCDAAISLSDRDGWKREAGVGVAFGGEGYAYL